MLKRELSNCCNAVLYNDSDVCTECGEHCSTNFDKMQDKYDEERDSINNGDYND